MMLTTEPRRVLADNGRDGAAEAIMAARFGVEVLAGLVRKGWASVDVETVRAGGFTDDYVATAAAQSGGMAASAAASARLPGHHL
jgi:hypothetical protein